MSKNSAKKNYKSLIEWIPTLKSKRAVELAQGQQPVGTFSKSDYYKSKGVN